MGCASHAKVLCTGTRNNGYRNQCKEEDFMLILVDDFDLHEENLCSVQPSAV